MLFSLFYVKKIVISVIPPPPLSVLIYLLHRRFADIYLHYWFPTILCRIVDLQIYTCSTGSLPSSVELQICRYIPVLLVLYHPLQNCRSVDIYLLYWFSTILCRIVDLQIHTCSTGSPPSSVELQICRYIPVLLVLYHPLQNFRSEDIYLFYLFSTILCRIVDLQIYTCSTGSPPSSVEFQICRYIPVLLVLYHPLQNFRSEDYTCSTGSLPSSVELQICRYIPVLLVLYHLLSHFRSIDIYLLYWFSTILCIIVDLQIYTCSTGSLPSSVVLQICRQ